MEDDSTTRSTITEGDNGDSFKEFRELVWRVLHIEDGDRKIAYIRNHLRKVDFKGDVASWIKLFICSVVPTRENLDLLRPERMPSYFSEIFGIEEAKIVEKFDEVDDIGQVIRHFFTESQKVKPIKKSQLTVQEYQRTILRAMLSDILTYGDKRKAVLPPQVLTFLEKISMTCAPSDVAEMISTIVPLCNLNDLKVIVRLVTMTVNLDMTKEDIFNVIHPQAFDFHLVNGVEATVNEYWTHSSSSSGNEDVTTTKEERKAMKLRIQEEDDEELADLVKENSSFSTTSSSSEDGNGDGDVEAGAGHSRQGDGGESLMDQDSCRRTHKSKKSPSKPSQLPTQVPEDVLEKVIKDLLHPSSATGKGGLFYLPTDQDSGRSEPLADHLSPPRAVSVGEKRKSSETAPVPDHEQDPRSPSKIAKLSPSSPTSRKVIQDEPMISPPCTSRKGLFRSSMDKDGSDQRTTIPSNLEDRQRTISHGKKEVNISDPASESNIVPTSEIEEQSGSDGSPPSKQESSEESSDPDSLHISDEMEPADAQNQEHLAIPDPNNSERSTPSPLEDRQPESPSTKEILVIPGPSRRRTDPSSRRKKWRVKRRKVPSHILLTLSVVRNRILTPDEVGSDEPAEDQSRPAAASGGDSTDPAGQMFRGCTLYPEEYADSVNAELLESFVELGGEVLDEARSLEATHVLHLYDKASEELPGCSVSARHVISEWLRDSIEARRLVDVRRYMVRLTPNVAFNSDHEDSPED